MRNLSMRSKISVLFITALVALFVMAIMSYSAFQSMSERANEVYQKRLVPIQQIDRLFINNSQIDQYLLRRIITQDSSENDQLVQTIDSLQAKNDQLLATYEKSQTNKQLLNLANEYKVNMNEIKKVRAFVLSLANANENEAAYEIFRDKLQPLIDHVYDGVLHKMELKNKQLATELNDQIKADKQAKTMWLAVIVVTAFALLSVVGVVISRLIVNPVQEMKRIIGLVADGDFSLRLTYEAKDEIGALGKDFNAMIDQLSFIISDMKVNAEQMKGNSTQLSQGAEQTSAAAGQISTLVHHAAQAAEHQLRNADENARVMEEMAQAVSKIAESYEQVSASSIDAAAQAKQGSDAVQQVIVQMEEIKRVSLQSTEMISELEGQSREISSIVTMITSIAEQTNLLALNAAIEAARAGEHGAGFAVVAGEVRKLAEQSRHSAEQISTLIEKIVNNTQVTMETIRLSSDKAVAGAALTHEVSAGFTEILRAVEQSAAQVHEVSAVSQQMNASTQQAAAGVMEMRSLATETLSQTQEIATATEQQLAAMQQIYASAEQLNEMATILSFASDQFKTA